MPQMSNMPFLFVSVVMSVSMMLWLINGFFNLSMVKPSNMNTDKNNKMSSKWPLN